MRGRARAAAGARPTGTVIDSYGPEDFHVVTVRLELIEPVDDPEEGPVAPLQAGFLAAKIRPAAA